MLLIISSNEKKKKKENFNSFQFQDTARLASL